MTRPTHLFTRPDGGTEAVFPEGFTEAADLVPLPAGYWGEEDAAYLASVEAMLLRRIDEQAEDVRLRFITPGSGQAMEYEELRQQAAAFVAGAEGPFRMLEADVAAGTIDDRSGLAVATVAEAAELVLWRRETWDVAGAAIKAARLNAKAAVRAASTDEAKRAAAEVDWEAVVSGE